MEQVFPIADGKGIVFNSEFSHCIGTFAFPPFGYLDLYVNLEDSVVLFYMLPRYKDENNPGFAHDILGPDDIVKIYREKINILEQCMKDYTKTVKDKIKNVFEVPKK